MNKIKAFIVGHKIISSLIAILVIWFVYTKYFKTAAATTQYSVATVQQGTIVSSISATGQVSASNQVDIRPKASGTIIYVNSALAGKTVKEGTIVAEVDPTDAQKAVRDAQINLQSAQLALQKLQVNQSNNPVDLQNSITSAQNTLTKSYQDGFSDVTAAFIDLPSIFNNAHEVLSGSTLNTGCQPNYCGYENLIDIGSQASFDVIVAKAQSDFVTASASYSPSFTDYRNATNTASGATTSALVAETLNTAQLLSQAIKSEQTMLDTLVASIQGQTGKTVPTIVTQFRSTLATNLSQVNSDVSQLLGIQNTIANNKVSLASSQQALTSSQTTNPIDLATQQISVQQKQAALTDAQQALADCYIRTPLAGVVATITAVKGADSGTSVGTIISPQEVVEVSLNEVDVSKILIGQQATLTFDALPDLTMTGKVVLIDTVGTVSQGVVSYNVKVAFDTSNTQVKPGMSVSAAIITNAKTDVIEVPTTAIKTQSGKSYVQVVTVPASLVSSGTATVTAKQLTSAIKNVSVTTGIQSDTMTEITSGLKVGDVVVVRTITGAAATSSSSTTSRTGGNPGFGN